MSITHCDPRVLKVLSSFLFKCPLKNGCPEKISYMNLEKHQNECKFNASEKKY